MSIKDLIRQAKSLAYEDDTTPAAKPGTPAPAPVPHPAFSLPPSFSTGTGAAAAPAPIGSPFAVPNTAVMDEKVYQNVLAKTNFNTTTVGKAIIKYYDALEGVIVDQSARFKAAIQQAQKLDGVTPTQVLATFDQLQAALDSDAKAFQNVADGVQANQITSRQTKITSIQQQIETLNSQMAQLQTELAAETTNHADAVAKYSLVQQRRAQEITAQKTQVAALLQ